MMTTVLLLNGLHRAFRFTKGDLFGILNRIINLFVCITLLVAIGMGFVSWIKRTKNTAVKVPHRVKKPASISLIICLIVLGLLMPLFGLSLIPCIYN